jgi:nitrite reductase/ring-hydroxylating ferredoxin subunit
LAAVPTAIAGASDWADTNEREKRVGLVHAAANTVALACYIASYVERRRGRRLKGVAWGWAGAGAATVGGYLGGHLVAALGIGVDNTAFEAGPDDWTDAGIATDVGASPVAVDAEGVKVFVVRSGGRLHALSDRCTHRGGPLHEGELDGDCIECPWHQSRFRVEDGDVVRGPATLPQPRYEARERNGRLEVRRLRD